MHNPTPNHRCNFSDAVVFILSQLCQRGNHPRRPIGAQTRQQHFISHPCPKTVSFYLVVCLQKTKQTRTKILKLGLNSMRNFLKYKTNNPKTKQKEKENRQHNNPHYFSNVIKEWVYIDSWNPISWHSATHFYIDLINSSLFAKTITILKCYILESLHSGNAIKVIYLFSQPEWKPQVNKRKQVWTRVLCFSLLPDTFYKKLLAVLICTLYLHGRNMDVNK